MSVIRGIPGKRRVVITGMGAVTPSGTSLDSSWAGLLRSEVNADSIKAFAAASFPTTFAYEVKDFNLRSGLIATAEEALLPRASLLAVNAMAEALEQAGLLMSEGRVDPAGLRGTPREAVIDPWRAAVILGIGAACPSVDWYAQKYLPGSLNAADLRKQLRYLPWITTSLAARLLGARGGGTSVHTACASSGQSLGEAFDMVAYGDADVVLTGGLDSMVHPLYLAGFSLLGALSKRNDDPASASRPFDADRDGFVLGEGACMLVFEEREHALRRGVPILGEVASYGVTESAYRITDLHPEGRGPIEAMQMALDDAGIDADEVGYINAHGTSTSVNDKIEALAIASVFPRSSCSVHVSSTKSMTGHMVAAAGAFEFAVAVLALRHQILPPSINITAADPQCDIPLTPPRATHKKMHYALSNSVGFGGSNTALLARHTDA